MEQLIFNLVKPRRLISCQNCKFITTEITNLKSKIIFAFLLISQLAIAQNNTSNNSQSIQQNNGRNIFLDKLQTASSINPNFVYISPIPGSIMNSPATNIILRTKKNLDKTSALESNIVEVTGTESGVHHCNIILCDDGKTISIQPDNSFAKGEAVKVVISDGLLFFDGSSLGRSEFSFNVSQHNFNSTNKVDSFREEKKVSNNIPQNNFVVTDNNDRKPDTINKILSPLPSDYPHYSVTSTNPSDGFIFLGNFTWFTGVITQPYMLILDNSGNPFFYKKLQGNCLDLKLQPNGMITYYDGLSKKFYGLDTTFSIVDSFYCKNGYATDLHDLRILPNGHFLLIGDDYETVDMSQMVSGGLSNAKVMGIIIQELDKNKNVVFQWRSWDHFKITDAAPDISMTSDTIDYVHTNAIEVDNDSSLIISCRHLDELTKINRQTGDIIWRMGGKNNQFWFLNDPVGFSHQHAVRKLSNGDLVVFDNGNLHYSVMPSRALEYKIDETNLKAVLVWQFRNTPDEYSIAMGYVQRLENGNTLIGWGATSPSITEVSPSGEKVFELSLPKNVFSYRAYRFQLGKPFYSALVPKLLYPPSGIHLEGNTIDLTWSRNILAQNFHVQVATDTSFTNLVYDNSNITDTTVAIKNLQPGYNYYWHVLSSNNNPNIGGYSGYSDSWYFSTLFTNVSTSSPLPQSFGLSQNFPNPFNPSTTIDFEIPKTTFVRLDVYDILGQEIKELLGEVKPAGYYQIDFDAKNLPSGVYFYKLEAGSYKRTLKMVVMK